MIPLPNGPDSRHSAQAQLEPRLAARTQIHRRVRPSPALRPIPHPLHSTSEPQSRLGQTADCGMAPHPNWLGSQTWRASPWHRTEFRAVGHDRFRDQVRRRPDRLPESARSAVIVTTALRANPYCSSLWRYKRGQFTDEVVSPLRNIRPSSATEANASSALIVALPADRRPVRYRCPDRAHAACFRARSNDRSGRESGRSALPKSDPGTDRG